MYAIVIIIFGLFFILLLLLLLFCSHKNTDIRTRISLNMLFVCVTKIHYLYNIFFDAFYFYFLIFKLFSLMIQRLGEYFHNFLGVLNLAITLFAFFFVVVVVVKQRVFAQVQGWTLMLRISSGIHKGLWNLGIYNRQTERFVLF